MSIAVLNTSANLTGKTLVAAENADTITGLKTFDRDPAAPFAVSAASAVVPNLDADKVDGIEGTDLFKKDGTVAMTGKLDLGTPGQIQFPAVQNAAAGVNVLDDYEEGTWTPVIGGSGGTSGQTYAIQTGSYIKIGQFVMAHFIVTLSAKGVITAGVQIQGLPFTSAGAQSVAPLQFISLATNWISVLASLATGATAVSVIGLAAAAASATAFATADIADNTTFAGTILYRASA